MRITSPPEDRTWGRIASFADPDGDEHVLFQPPGQAPPRGGPEHGCAPPRDRHDAPRRRARRAPR